MKTILSILGVLVGIISLAQGFNEQLVVPLSNPGSSGTLNVGLVRGDIFIESYSGTEVVINATAKKDDCKSCDDDRSNAPEGMKRIKTSSIEVGASERDNKVKVETNSWKQPIDLNIKVPKNFDLDVSTTHGSITVDGVSGALEVSGVHGDITLTDISGTLLCNTTHGDIKVNFKKITPQQPMSFVTLHGNIDISLPAGTKALAKMKSDRGEIYTDFDMEVTKSAPERKTSDKSYRVTVNTWAYGEMNGGGPEYTFKNMHGNIYIREN